MKIKLFDFPELLKEAAEYERLGFKVEIDDPINGIFSAELKGNGKTDAVGMLAMLESCELNKLYPNLEIDGQIYNYENGFKILDEIAAADTYVNGVGTMVD